MGAGIDVGIDPHRDARGLAALGGEPRQQFELGLGFDIDAENIGGQRRAQFGFGLADAGEQDLVRAECRRPAPASTRRPDTTSAPAPSLASVRSTDWLELAFMA